LGLGLIVSGIVVLCLALPVWVLAGGGLNEVAGWANILALPVTAIGLLLAVVDRDREGSVVQPTNGELVAVGRRPWMSPRLDRMVERPELGAQLLAVLLADGPAEVGLTTGLQGAGGFGKTRLATWVSNLPEIDQHYPGGLLWVTVGQEAHGADLAVRINDLSYAVSGQRPAISDPNAAGAELGRLLDEGEPALLVVDDVWDDAQLLPFRLGGHSCTRLFTTRIPDLLPTGGVRIRVDAMTVDQAQRLIADGVAGIPAAAVERLASLAGRWPVLLNLINGALRRRMARGQPADEAAWEVVLQLEAEGPGSFDATRPSDRTQAVSATVAASSALLSVEDQERYLDLAIFPEDVDIPLSVLELLWPRVRVNALCEELVGLGLAADYRLDWPEPRLVLHDVVRAYLRSVRTAKQAEDVHGRLVDAAAGLLPTVGRPTQWWLIPEAAGYLWRYVPYHLRHAGRTKDLQDLLADLRWSEAKTRLLGSVVAVEADLALTDTPATNELRRQLSINASLLGPIDPPSALGATLASRLDGIVGLQDVLARYRATLPPPRLDPAWPLPDQTDLLHIPETGHTGGVTSCAFSPDGNLLATTSDDSTARIWRVTDGAEHVVTLSGHSGGVWSCAFSPDGEFLITASTDKTARIWRSSTGELVVVLRGHSDWVRTCAFSPDGSLVATASADKTTRLWRVADGTEYAVLTGHTDDVRSCAFSPDGSLLATASADKTARIWSVGDKSERILLADHPGGVWSCAFSPSGSLLATASYGTVRLSQVSDGCEVSVLTGHADEVDCCAFSPDGALLAGTSYGVVRLWRVADGTEYGLLRGHTGAVWGCAFSPDGSTLATVSNDQSVRLWSVDNGAQIVIIAGQTSKVNSCAFSPQGDLVATTSYDSTVRLLRVADGSEWKALVGHTSRVISCAFSPDGSTLATTSYRISRLWDVQTGEVLKELEGHEDWVRSCAFSPDGAVLATGSADRTVRLWKVVDGTETAVLTGHASGVRSCAFAPSGEYLASADAAGTVLLWSLAYGTKHMALVGHTSGVQSCTFSPDGRLLATASVDRTVRLWRVADGIEISRLEGHTSWADRCAFSPDGTLLATASNDQTVRLWQVRTSRCHCALRVAGPLVWVAWHPGGTLLCTVGGRGTYMFDYKG
jgi:WD40 repeat protein